MYTGDGSSGSWCHDSFHGGNAFSAPETKALKDAVANTWKSQEVFAFFSLHCYSQLMLIPYGYTRVKAADYDELVRIFCLRLSFMAMSTLLRLLRKSTKSYMKCLHSFLCIVTLNRCWFSAVTHQNQPRTIMSWYVVVC